MDKFWSLPENKVTFQQFFIKWVKETYTGKNSVYLGGSHIDDMTACLRVSNGHVTSEYLLKCNHEEADDRIMYHINHGVKVDKLQ